jgi:DNA topoisomerase VI subunit B
MAVKNSIIVEDDGSGIEIIDMDKVFGKDTQPSKNDCRDGSSSYC